MSGKSARDILDERLARGEITLEEYEERCAALVRNAAPKRPPPHEQPPQADPVSPARAAASPRRGSNAAPYIVGAIVLVLALPFASGYARFGTLDTCDAFAAHVGDLMPEVLEALSADYPFRVGLISGLLNEQGELDALLKELFSAGAQDGLDGENRLTCYYWYATSHFNRAAQVREMKTIVARDLGLAE